MKNSRRDAIVDDLLVRFPKGDKRKLKKDDYELDESYCYESGRHKTYVKTTARSAHYGYKAVVLFDLDLRTAGAVQQYVRDRFYEGKNVHRGGYGGHQGGVTRKTNRLWSRIEPGLLQVKDSAIPGVYRLSSRWGAPLGHVNAGSPDEAKNIGLAMFSHVLDEAEKRRLNAELVSRSDIEDVLRLNKEIFATTREEISNRHGEIENITKAIEKYKQRLEAMISLESLLLERSEDDSSGD